MSDLRRPMPSRDKYPRKDCAKRYPACQDKCPDMLKAKKENQERKAVERAKRQLDHDTTEYIVLRNNAAARRKMRER